MYIFSMDMASTKHVDALRLTLKPAQKLRWTQLRVDDEAFGQYRHTDPELRSPGSKKRQRRNRRRLAALSTGVGSSNAPTREERRLAACAKRLHPGAMAPENTTQYLIKEHEDNAESSSISHGKEAGSSSIEGL
ncbi:uncharacterized protein LOC144068967 [Stigmatopora argus]